MHLTALTQQHNTATTQDKKHVWCLESELQWTVCEQARAAEQSNGAEQARAAEQSNGAEQQSSGAEQAKAAEQSSGAEL